MEFINAYHVPYTPDKWLTFDDVTLVPQSSRFNSRFDPAISLTTKYLPNVSIPSPIITTPMDTVTDYEMVEAMSKLGGVGILHRHHKTQEERFNKIVKIYEELKITPSFAIGLGTEELQFVAKVLEKVPMVVLCLDIAHGHMENCYQQIRKLVITHGDKIRVIAGSVATPYAVVDMIKAGASSIRLGVGCGCFVPGTQIKIIDGYKNIEDIQKGDLVFTFTGEIKEVEETTSRQENHEIIRINDDIECTFNHEFYVVHKSDLNKINGDNIHEFADWILAEELNDNYLLIELES